MGMVALVGLPGSGKSTIGRQLGRNLGCRFVDADHEIEQHIGCSISSYFELHGELAFREVEESVIARLSQLDGLVLATGGGAVLREANRHALKAGGNLVIYLRAQVDDLARRLQHDTQRPLLKDVSPQVRLRELFAQRDPLYRDIADFAVDTGRSSVATLAHLIAMQLELARPEQFRGRAG
ncbi:MAG TPA: shikimate kinase [Ideonella sp.]|uniref:shikimate kinase n=1 Tax=Ideonella sp. TaxID=1929293 RepID=UPI002B911898|nr:shikimate kinase [Ideonella sp.]HSI49299.1 shikimate kinase [Ideonella sp.]